jgi:RES domain-containing protein
VKPGLTFTRQDDTHRLIPSRFSDEGVLARLGDSDRDVPELIELDGATDDRWVGEANLLPGIGVHELLFGVPYAHIVNAAFTYAHPTGSRFNSPDRGAWYAAFELETAQAEIAFHKTQELLEIAWREPETFVFYDYLADFRAEFHDIRGDDDYSDCLDPKSYISSQRLARELLGRGSAGIVYPCVRRPNGTCLVCFRPALVTNVRRNRTVTLTFPDAYSSPVIRTDR